ncbi:putative membrane protein, partial [Plasmodium gaboni]
EEAHKNNDYQNKLLTLMNVDESIYSNDNNNFNQFETNKKSDNSHNLNELLKYAESLTEQNKNNQTNEHEKSEYDHPLNKTQNDNNISDINNIDEFLSNFIKNYMTNKNDDNTQTYSNDKKQQYKQNEQCDNYHREYFKNVEHLYSHIKQNIEEEKKNEIKKIDDNINSDKEKIKYNNLSSKYSCNMKENNMDPEQDQKENNKIYKLYNSYISSYSNDIHIIKDKQGEEPIDNLRKNKINDIKNDIQHIEDMSYNSINKYINDDISNLKYKKNTNVNSFNNINKNTKLIYTNKERNSHIKKPIDNIKNYYISVDNNTSSDLDNKCILYNNNNNKKDIHLQKKEICKLINKDDKNLFNKNINSDKNKNHSNNNVNRKNQIHQKKKTENLINNNPNLFHNQDEEESNKTRELNLDIIDDIKQKFSIHDHIQQHINYATNIDYNNVEEKKQNIYTNNKYVNEIKDLKINNICDNNTNRKKVETFCIHSNEIKKYINKNKYNDSISCDEDNKADHKNDNHYDLDEYEKPFGYNTQDMKRIEETNNIFYNNYSNDDHINYYHIDEKKKIKDILYDLKKYYLPSSQNKKELKSYNPTDTEFLEYINKYLDDNNNMYDINIYNEVICKNQKEENQINAHKDGDHDKSQNKYDNNKNDIEDNNNIFHHVLKNEKEKSTYLLPKFSDEHKTNSFNSHNIINNKTLKIYNNINMNNVRKNMNEIVLKKNEEHNIKSVTERIEEENQVVGKENFDDLNNMKNEQEDYKKNDNTYNNKIENMFEKDIDIKETLLTNKIRKNEDIIKKHIIGNSSPKKQTNSNNQHDIHIKKIEL